MAVVSGERDDALSTLSDPEGDYTTLKVDANGALWVVQSGSVTITQPVSMSDGGGSITVDGTVSVAPRSGTITNGAETSVAGSAVQVLAANANRKKLIIQNTGAANVRVGVSGVTATTGVRLVRNGSLLLEMPDCPTQAIYAIREGAVSSTVFAQEVT